MRINTGSPGGVRKAVVGVWLLLALMVALSLAAAPFRLRDLSQPCTSAPCLEDNLLLRADMVAVLNGMGLSLQQYAIFMLTTSFLQLVISWSLAALLLRQPEPDRMTILVAIYLSLGGFSNPVLSALPAAVHWTSIPVSVLIYAGYLSFILVFYLFPDGRFVPPWTKWLALVLAINELITTILTTYAQLTGREVAMGWYGFIESSLWLGSFLAIIATQIYRYFRVSGPVQRLQTRWVVFGSSLALLVGVTLSVIGASNVVNLNPWYRLLTIVVSSWLPLAILVSFGIAMLRFRLWEIDILIRRTLQYGILTALLGLLYFGSVTVLQGIFTALGGSQSQVITVISTLIIAALFRPLRRRIQDVIDRRFYRQKYNAEMTLVKFASAARGETNLDQMASSLLHAVEASLQPEILSLWMQKTAFPGEKQDRSV